MVSGEHSCTFYLSCWPHCLPPAPGVTTSLNAECVIPLTFHFKDTEYLYRFCIYMDIKYHLSILCVL